MAATITCKKFADVLSRRAEHLDDEVVRDVTPIDGWIGHVTTGRFAAEDGVSHTYDRFTRVMPDMSNPWRDVTNQSCIGTPCDPDETVIGFGYVRDSYHLQEANYSTDLICFDLIMSADKAKQQFAFLINDILRPATSLITSDRMRAEAFRFAGEHWVAGANFGLPAGAFTFTEAGNLINVIPSQLPTSKLTNRMLQRRVEPQLLRGALGPNPFKTQPMLELVVGATTLDELVHDGNITDHWRFERWEVGGEFYKYGWLARVGNYAVRVDPHPLRFQINGGVLNRVFPYMNIAATQGIRGIDNPAYLTAPVEAGFIWHRQAMRYLVQDATQINPMMPFGARDYGGKWQFVTDGLVCKQPDGTLTPVDNRRKNKGQFIADWKGATQKWHNEWAEVFLYLREIACVVDVPPCADTPDYVEQDYSSHNDPCDPDIPAE